MSLVSIYNNHRYARSVLKKFRKTNASFTIELHGDYWRFHGQDERLAYDGPMRPFLESVRSQTIPASVYASLLDFSSDHFPIHDGCIIVEILDFRIPSDRSISLGPNGVLGPGQPNFAAAVNGTTSSSDPHQPSGLGLPYPKVPITTSGPPAPPQSQNAFTAVAVAMAKTIQGKLGESHSSRNAFKRGRESSQPGHGSGIKGDSNISNGANGLGHRPSLSQGLAQPNTNLNLIHPNTLDPTSSLIPPAQQPQAQIEQKELPIESVLRYRTLMRPDGTSLWEQMVYTNAKQRKGEEWDDLAVLHLEARVLAATAPNLCLDPTTILPTRTANLSMNLTYPMPSYISHDGTYIPPSDRPKSTLIIPTGPGLEEPSAYGTAATVGPSAETLKLDEEAEVLTRVASKAKAKDDAREAWLNERGLRKEDIDALVVGHDPAEPLSKEHLFEMSSRVEKYWQENSSWRRPPEPYSAGTLTGSSEAQHRIDGVMQVAMADMAAAQRTNGYDGADGGTGGGGGALDVVEGSAQKPKKSKKKKKDAQGDGLKQEDGMDVDVGPETNGDGSVALPIAADVGLEEKAKSKKKSKKERLMMAAAANAAKEEAMEAAESPPVTGVTVKMGKKRPADEMIESSVPPMSALTDPGTAVTDKPKKLTKKQRELAAKQAEAVAEESVIILEPPKKKVKKAKLKASTDEGGNVGIGGMQMDDNGGHPMLPEYGNQDMQNMVVGGQGMDLPELAPVYQPHPDMQQAAFLAAAQYGIGNGMQFGHNNMGMQPMELPIQVQPNHGYSQPLQQPDQSQIMDMGMLQQLQQQLQQAEGYRQMNLNNSRHPGQSRAPGGG